MRITFLLPGVIRIPIGGAKVVYRFSEILAKRGHAVSIVAPRSEGYRVRDLMKVAAVRMRDRWHGVADRPYYKTPPAVEYIETPAPDPKFFPDADALVATGWQTAEWVDAQPREKGTKFYFLQNDETYLGDAAAIRQTWSLPLKKIVNASWLKREVETAGEVAFGPIPDAVDSSEFFQTDPVEARAASVAMMLHRLPVKGSREGLEALEIVRGRFPNLEVHCFAARRPPMPLPQWINLEVRPNLAALRSLYNRSAIFLHPSHREGWPLPPAEAMACGCAVVAADNPGVREYLVPEENGLVAPIGNVRALAEKIILLLEESATRIRIAHAGRETMARFSWEAGARLFESILATES